MDSCLHRESVANQKLGDIQGFRWYRWECIGPDILMTGAVVIGTITKGQHKGRPKYSRDVKRVVVTHAECDAEYARYETETRKCGDCLGTGKKFARWHYIEGTSYRECDKCHGSGLLDSAA